MFAVLDILIVSLAYQVRKNNLIECNHETEVALVEADIVEKLADIAIKKWCDKNLISGEEVSRECTLYLKPNDSENSIKKLLRYERLDESEAAD
ncbi:MAG: hypothetical protein LH628_19655 [Microcoleus sp. CAN_BIN18]|nr:hypothetical protein [Microcoleus sp. CAN_BIN18]